MLVAGLESKTLFEQAGASLARQSLQVGFQAGPGALQDAR